jgi:hypothetical protein
MSVNVSLAFGKVTVGHAVTRQLRIYNTGTKHSLIIARAIPSDPADYALSGTGTCGAFPATIAPRKDCTLGVVFAPDTTGAHSATLALTENSIPNPYRVPLTGVGRPKHR